MMLDDLAAARFAVGVLAAMSILGAASVLVAETATPVVTAVYPAPTTEPREVQGGVR